MSGMSAARSRIIKRIADGLLALRELDEATGSPDPILTALAGGLSAALSLVRVSLAHAGALERFEEIIKLARALEKDSWKKHRVECQNCGVQ